MADLELDEGKDTKYSSKCFIISVKMFPDIIFPRTSYLIYVDKRGSTLYFNLNCILPYVLGGSMI